MLVNVPNLVTPYYTEVPDPSNKKLAGETIETVITQASGNGVPIGGLKVTTKSRWFAARPSGTENIYKIYAESFRGADHLRCVLEEAQSLVNDAFKMSSAAPIPSEVNR